MTPTKTPIDTYLQALSNAPMLPEPQKSQVLEAVLFFGLVAILIIIAAGLIIPMIP